MIIISLFQVVEYEKCRCKFVWCCKVSCFSFSLPRCQAAKLRSRQPVLDLAVNLYLTKLPLLSKFQAVKMPSFILSTYQAVLFVHDVNLLSCQSVTVLSCHVKLSNIVPLNSPACLMSPLYKKLCKLKAKTKQLFQAQ